MVCSVRGVAQYWSHIFSTKRRSTHTVHFGPWVNDSSNARSYRKAEERGNRSPIVIITISFTAACCLCECVVISTPSCLKMLHGVVVLTTKRRYVAHPAYVQPKRRAICSLVTEGFFGSLTGTHLGRPKEAIYERGARGRGNSALFVLTASTPFVYKSGKGQRATITKVFLKGNNAMGPPSVKCVNSNLFE